MDETEYVYPEVTEELDTSVQDLIALAQAHAETKDREMRGLLLQAARMKVLLMSQQAFPSQAIPAPTTLTLQ